jgi:hypothetical protein
VRLGTWMPFERVPASLAFFTHTHASIETARRLTEGAGAALVTTETAAVERLERELPDEPEGPAVQQLSVDGAMVPLVRGEWGEVKTLAVGTVGHRVTTAGEEVTKTTDLRYFSRFTDAERFGRLATIATHAAGTTRAGTVCAVLDGAPWLQGFIDLQRPDAVRILDFPHAAEHLATAAQAVWGPSSATATAWLDQQLHELKHGDPDQVLSALALLPASTTEAESTRDGVIAYLVKRRAQIAYADFRAAGYPIGDGIVESANKLVVEQRLKGSGMHWARANVNPMVALRAGVCSDQWEIIWPTIETQLRDQEREHRHVRHVEHREARQPVPALPEPSPPPVSLPVDPPSPREKLVVNGHPTKDHPWRHFHLPGSRDFRPDAKP